ncbi:MAG: biopolymer transporter ExbD [Crocinitomicaceae bacterium]|nr:biopolymer transporter ExbD [Flavobacteriales bacterium]NQZ35670.1 biopolymer transporter ExbD [Crocinitomicaceae bacterium]
MSKFKKGGKKPAPAINTSSLPDIVFMLLFFFMVATTTKDADPTVEVTQPTGVRAEDMTPFKQRSEIDFLYLGVPRNTARAESFNMGYALFLDNVAQPSPGDLYNVNTVRRWKLDKFDAKPDRMEQPIKEVITCIKADEQAPTGIIFDIRKELQEIEALKLAYAVQDNGSY